MSYFEDIYKKRLNRYGEDFQDRIKGERVRFFSEFLQKTLYQVKFIYDGDLHLGSLERYKQDYTETMAYLLTELTLELPSGTILYLESKNGNMNPWMVWWLERIEQSGYNRYIMLKMNQELIWTVDGVEKKQLGYFVGPGKTAISDTQESSSKTVFYEENDNKYRIITAYEPTLIKDVYFEFTQGETIKGFNICETDIYTTPGVIYISLDPTMIKDKTPKPVAPEGANDADYFWLNGGA